MEFVFRPIEWLIEGSPSQQKKLNASGDTMQKTGKKILKHVIFFIVSFIIAHTFLSYILGVDEVIKIIKEPITQNIGLLFGLIIFTFLFYAVYAYVREIVCTTICPYGRLQGVMVDKNTMGVSYDYQRGEPRGLFNKNTTREFGDCISCNQCVHVCPTGIDIRNGSQMECVGCTACIDACISVMDTMKFDRGLIRYASENEISSSSKFVFTTRMKAYTVLLGVLLVAMSFMIASRKTVDTYISRAGGQLYQEMPNGNISNLFEAKIINKTKQEMPVTFTLEGIEGTVKLVGENKINLKAEDVTKCSFFIEIPKEKIPKHSSKITIGVYSNDTKIQTLKIKFLGPFH
jgi:cytochrome c oxidase accessory protein FixG